MKRVTVIEVNEVPLRVLRTAVDRALAPNIARLLRDGSVAETTVDSGQEGRYLYPSQTWATLATGVDFDDHGVYWYGDPKPADYPLYWQLAAAAGASVGLVGTLHSSPLAIAGDVPNLAFAIPDCFASDAATVPTRYERAQAAAIGLAQVNGRNSSVKDSVGMAGGLMTLAGGGMTPSTVGRIGKLVAEIGSKRVAPERLRLAQDLLFSDVFLHLAQRHSPDLSIYFTNHIASMMHRYWYALYPQDWPTEIYPETWQARYRDEIMTAVAQLDRFVGRILDWAEETGRAVLLVSSMGQQANLDIDTNRSVSPVLRNSEQFAAALGLTGSPEPLRAMIPTQSWRWNDEAEARANGERLSSTPFVGGTIEVDVVDSVLSVTYRLEPDASCVGSGSHTRSLDDAGFTVEAIDDHNSGVHDQQGTFVLWNAGDVELPRQIELTEVAPGLLSMLGIAPAMHHRPTTWAVN